MRRVQNTWPIPAMLLAVLFGGTLNAQEHFTDCAFNTGESATIVIEAAIEPTFFGEPFEPGDEIAVFTPSGMCAGVVMWVDDSTNIALTAWGDDPITPEVDGFVTGELLAYRIWSTSFQLEAGVPPIDVDVTYDSCDGRPPLCTESGEYERDSLTFLSELTVSPPLPVELLSFDAVVRRTEVTLRWVTTSETNNAGFEIQLQSGDDWDALGFVEGHGTTTEAQTYSFMVGDMTVGAHTFRLKQIDFNGAFDYSPEVEAVIEVVDTHQLSNAYPNPFNPQSQFTLAVAHNQHVTAELFNTLGQRVVLLFEGTVEANQSQQITIDGAGFASGMYIVRVAGERFADALTVTLLK